VRRFKLACAGRKPINLYGSSEVAADVLVHEVQDADADGLVPIGKPIANTQVYVLDRMSQPTPVGMPGVIHAGGACLALGYWGKPDLTAEPWPGGLPFVFSNVGMQMIQQADRITILYADDHEVRRVRLNESHPARITPKWYGDSVGYYEGDTLVIDTIGIKVGPFSMADWYGTMQRKISVFRRPTKLCARLQLQGQGFATPLHRRG
jgi:acyl-CoA synthetase (AMP-forming)/AMP-acid ligase II